MSPNPMRPDGDLRAVVFCPTPLGIFEQSLALQERGVLGTMAVDVYCDLNAFPQRLLPDGRLRHFLRKRHHEPLDGSRVRTRILPSLAGRVGSRLFAKTNEQRDRIVFWHNDQFDRWVSRNMPAFGNLAFGYESSSLHTFRRSQAQGIPRVLYQPIGVAEFAMEILGDEQRRVPHMAHSLRYCWFPPAEIQRRREERSLADAIVCASSFTKSTLVDQGVAPEKIFVEPYGVDQSVFAPSLDKFERFSVVWASSFTQTKGMSYLLEALTSKHLADAELVLAGYPSGSDAVSAYEDRIRVRRAGRVPRPELARLMARSHVHVFPTLLDGFGRNIIEAMASGLPVVASPHCAGPDLIEDGKTGFIVPIRDVNAIVERLRWLKDHPKEAVEMGLRARDRVAGLTQADYRRRFSNRLAAVWRDRNGRSSLQPGSGG